MRGVPRKKNPQKKPDHFLIITVITTNKETGEREDRRNWKKVQWRTFREKLDDSENLGKIPRKALKKKHRRSGNTPEKNVRRDPKDRRRKRPSYQRIRVPKEMVEQRFGKSSQGKDKHSEDCK